MCPVAVFQIFGICLAQNLVSDVKAVKANWWHEPPHRTSRPGQLSTLGTVQVWMASQHTCKRTDRKKKGFCSCSSVTLEMGKGSFQCKPNSMDFNPNISIKKKKTEMPTWELTLIFYHCLILFLGLMYLCHTVAQRPSVSWEAMDGSKALKTINWGKSTVSSYRSNIRDCFFYFQ